MKKIIFIILIVTWLCISLAVRVYGLESSPQTLGFDEAALGYNAYSLMLTGKDEFGTPLPFSLRSFDDYKPALYSYLTIPFYYFFDVNQTTTRLPSAFFGTISLLFSLLIFKKISKSGWVTSFIVLVFISFLPWRMHFSRVAFESNLSMAFFTITCYFLLFRKAGLKFIVGAIIFSILSIYSYHGARLAIPLLWILIYLDPIKALFFRNQRPKFKYHVLFPLLIVLISYLPLFLRDSGGSVLRRLSQTNVFEHFYPFSPSELLMNPDQPFLSILANPLYYLGAIITGHIFAYLSPQNLASSIYQEVLKSPQAINESGMFGWMGGFLFIAGLLSWLKKIIASEESRFIIYWILATITPAIVTWNWFYPVRALNVFPGLEIIIGLGILVILEFLRKIKPLPLRLALSVALFYLAITTACFNVVNEYKYSVWETNGEFQPGGFKEGAQLLDEFRKKYQTVYIDSNQAQSFEILLFYMKYPPAEIQKYAHLRPTLDNGIKYFNFDNFVYQPYNWIEDRYKNNFVIWTSSEVKEEEITSTPGAKLYKIKTILGFWSTSIITKD